MSTGTPYAKLAVRVESGVATASFQNPPINLISLELMGELLRFAHEAAADASVRAVVLRSDVPDFWLAHFDVAAILRFPTQGPAALPERVEDNPYHALCELLRTMPKATIAEIGGRVGGGGAELAMSCDMRFGALGRTVVSQPEVALGILPGGTGTQRLPRLVGRGRALELILGCDELDAATAERWGWLDRALAPDALRPFVERLARRIAGFPGGAIAAAKRSVLAAEPSWERGLLLESHLFQLLLRTPEAQARMRRFLELGGQTPEVERELGRLCERLAEGDA
jgi:enoyl-CoA hydratase/carnithine racemase